MKLVPKGTAFMASGTVYARVVLPRGMDINLDVNRVLPDVLIFDGEVPLVSQWKNNNKDSGPAPPLPDPLPERAFARIRPNQWLDSLSKADEVPGAEGSVYTVTADLVDVPLQVLPDREKTFSSFVGKVCIFLLLLFVWIATDETSTYRQVVFGSKGAVAGLLGNAAVTVDVEGLPTGSGEAGEMELSGLPFQGSVVVGKRSL